MNSELYKLTCREGHVTETDLNSLADHLEEDRCPECRSRFTKCFPDRICFSCCCGYSTYSNFSDKEGILETGCPDADPNIEAPENIRYHHMAIKGSDAALFYLYEWSVHGPSHKRLLLEDMADYWEYLVHFTDERGFFEILSSHKIHTSKNGYYKYTKKNECNSVCLTETPLSYANRFFERYGSIGFVFKKSSLQKIGALPLIHLPQNLIKEQELQGGFVSSLTPYVQLIRTESTDNHPIEPEKRYDWMSDREWRVPTSIDLSIVKPVGMVFAEPPTFTSSGDALWRAKIQAALTYNEVKMT